MRLTRVLCVLGAVLGCGGAPEVVGGDGSDGDDKVEQSGQFLVWNPGQALLLEHSTWHAPVGCGSSPGVRKCLPGTLFGSGEDFLIFHRNFTERLRDEWERQGLTGDTAPWFDIPAEMKASSAWSADVHAAYSFVNAMIDVRTGQRFASLERFGEYIENNIHNQLHGIAQVVYGEAEILTASMSPSSTYFFKIHGWVEYQFQRYQRGDFNRDGNSDVINRYSSDGKNRLRFLNGTALTTYKDLPRIDPADACQWYLGATTDLNFDGGLDVVWHGPGCNRARFWPLDPITLARGTPSDLMDDANPPAPVVVPSNLELIGAGDFNADMRPDLAWRNKDTNDLVFWRMNGTTRKQVINIDVPASYRPVGVADASLGGTPDIFVWRLVNGLRQYHWLNMSPPFSAGSLTSAGFSTPTTDNFSGTGRFSLGSSVSDIVFTSTANSPAWASFAQRAGSTYNLQAGWELPSTSWIAGPR